MLAKQCLSYNIRDELYSFGSLDKRGRCVSAVALIGPETISSRGDVRRRDDERRIKPTGWMQASYPELIRAGCGSLYNRCHLIGWSLLAIPPNPRNIITGTRQLNEAMERIEKQVRRLVNKTSTHILYRATPYFDSDELVARSITVEAVSAEDGGQSLRINVLIPNIQRGVRIDYKTGASSRRCY